VLSRAITPKRRGRRPLAALAVLTMITGLLVAAGTAFAVHDEEFQLDGDTTATVTDQTVPDDTIQIYDWDSLFNADGTPTSVIDPDATTGFNDGAFERDFLSKTGRTGECTEGAGLTFCTADATTFATGSKDTLDITPGWQCNRDNNVNSKIDIMNAYAAQYIDPVSGDQIMYFGMDKNKDNGNNNVAFWFLQNDAFCESPGGAVNFTGAHVDGDVLVVSAFTNGGGVSNIDAYRWDGVNDCIDNPDNPATCDGAAIGSGGDCKIAAGLDDICATTNSGPLEENDNITTQWLTSDATLGVGNTVVTTNFFEGGINLTEVFEGAAGGVPSCFSTFIANTRSSQELTATLFDFARGSLGGCQTDLTTDAGDNGAEGEIDSPADIGTGSVMSGTDTATLTIDGTDVWAGTLTWYLCGPDDDLTMCDADEGVLVTTRNVSNTSLAADFISGQAELTSAGTYCWTAVFDPDDASEAAGVDGAQDDGTNECFTVDPVKPTLTTQASCTSDPCVVGVDTISDTATLSDTASQPGSGGPSTTYPTINPTVDGDPANNSITWKLYAPGECDTGTPLVDTSRLVSGDGTYPTAAQADVEYVLLGSDAIGDYVWVASYPGDSPNTLAADTTGCDDAAETVTVIGTSAMTSAQDWLPNDTVTLTSDSGTLTGDLTITLYEGTFTEDATGCTPALDAVAVTGQSYPFSPSNEPSPAEFSTANEDFFVTADNDGDYFWLVVYDDDFVESPPSHCESTSITITD
jgi:hypothetical protein